MNEKEFRKLKRLELVEIIYQLEKDLENEKAENENLRSQLADANSRLEQMDSLEKTAQRMNQMCERMEKSAGMEKVVSSEKTLEKINQLCEAMDNMQREYKKGKKDLTKVFLKEKKKLLDKLEKRKFQNTTSV